MMGRRYYVDATNGKDENSGLSVDEAWRTLGKVEQQVFNPGDQILLKSGEVWHEGLKLHGQGRPGEVIYLGSYLVDKDDIRIGEGLKPKIHAEGKVLYGLHLHNLTFWEIEHIEVSNKGEYPLAGRTGIMVSADEHFEGAEEHYIEHIYLKDVYVHSVNGEPTVKDSHNGGIFYSILSEDTTNYLAFKDIRIENCYVKDVERTGISFGGSNCVSKIVGEDLSVWDADAIKPYMHQDVVIRNNYVQRSGGDAIVPMYAFRPLIEHNTSQEASFSTIGQPDLMFNAAIWPWQCYEAVFRYNEVFKTYLNGDGQGFDCDWSYGTVYEYNYSHHNEGGFMLVCQKNAIKAHVRNNVSYNDQRCIFMTSNVQEAYVEGNLIYTGSHLETQMFSEHRGPVVFTGNTFYKEGDNLELDWHIEGNKYRDNFYAGYNKAPEQQEVEVNKEHLRYIGEIKTLEGAISAIDKKEIHNVMLLENEKRMIYKGKGKIVCGVEQFTLEQLKAYIKCYQSLLTAEKALKEEKLSEKTISIYYEENKDKHYQDASSGKVFPLEMVKDHIKYKLIKSNID